MTQLHARKLGFDRGIRRRFLTAVRCVTGLWALALMGWQEASADQTWQAPQLPKVESAALSGQWAKAQALNAARLGKPPLDETAFILDDVLLKQHRKFAEYSGDISGRWLGVAAFVATKFPQDFANFPKVMAGLAGCQKPDGHFGVDQELPKIERERDMPILWGNGRLLIGLVEQYEQKDDHEALQLARKLGDYFIATDNVYNRQENIRGVGGSYADGFVTCYFSCIEGLAGLGRATGEQRYLQEAKRIAALALTLDDFTGLHSHGRLCAVRGFAELYAITGEARWLEGAQRDWQIFNQRHLLPTGGVKEVLTADFERDEGCAEADWLRLNLLLWRVTGDGVYLDSAERALKNHFAYQQFANGGAGHRVLYHVSGAPVAFKALSEEAWWCCSEHWGRALVDVSRSAVTSRPKSLQVNLAIDADTAIAGPGGIWRTSVRETEAGMRIRVTPPQTNKPIKTELIVHQPSWAENGMLYASKGFKVKIGHDAWTVSGTWRAADELVVELPVRLRVEATSQSAVFLRRNDMLAAAPNPANAWLTDNLPSSRPVVLWSAAMDTKNGKLLVPASLAPEPDPAKPEQWRLLELTTLRAQAAMPDHQLAWFSFQARQASAEQVERLIGELSK